MHKNKGGYTIVELLIVIVIIGILVAIIIVAYNGIRTRAQVASLTDGLTKVEKAVRLWAIEEDFTSWPIDPVAGGGTSFTDMYSIYPSLNNYLQAPPSVIGVHSEDWFYDNDGDAKTDCTAPYDGVNVVIRFVTDTGVATMLDQQHDDSNINCGKIRYVDQRIFYTISNTQSIQP